MPVMKRDELLNALTEVRSEFEAVLAGLTAERLLAPGAEGDWSVKDILAHVTAWEVDLLTNLGKVRRGLKPGKTGWTAETIQAQNQKWYREQKQRPLDRVLEDWRGARRQTLRLVESLTNKDLAAPQPWLRDRPLFTYFVDLVLDHEREHVERLREWRHREAGLSANGAGPEA